MTRGKSKFDRITEGFTWPEWVPRWSAWGNAIALALFSVGAGAVTRVIFRIGLLNSGFGEHPESLIWFTVLSLLSPIPVIALIHHFIHSLIGAFAPQSLASSEIGQVKGLFPNLVSWWEGLTSWMIFMVSSLVTMAMFLVIHPLFAITLNRQTLVLGGYTDGLATTLGAIWLVVAAILYQIERSVEKRVMTIALAEAKTKARKR